MMVEETKEVRGYCFRPTITNGNFPSKPIFREDRIMSIPSDQLYAINHAISSSVLLQGESIIEKSCNLEKN